MLRVRDMMTRHVVSLSGDTTIDSAAWRLAAEGISGAPVRDQAGNIIGVISNSDLVAPYLEERGKVAVKDVMTAGVWAAHPDAPALEAVELMVTQGIHRVIVIRGPGQIEGIVTSMDVMRALLKREMFFPESVEKSEATGTGSV